MAADLNDGNGRRYVRRDQRMSKLVYRSQAVRNRLGRGVAHVFMRIMKVDPAVAQRVLRSQKAKLRR